MQSLGPGYASYQSVVLLLAILVAWTNAIARWPPIAKGTESEGGEETELKDGCKAAFQWVGVAQAACIVLPSLVRVFLPFIDEQRLRVSHTLASYGTAIASFALVLILFFVDLGYAIDGKCNKHYPLEPHIALLPFLAIFSAFALQHRPSHADDDRFPALKAPVLQATMFFWVFCISVAVVLMRAFADALFSGSNCDDYKYDWIFALFEGIFATVACGIAAFRRGMFGGVFTFVALFVAAAMWDIYEARKECDSVDIMSGGAVLTMLVNFALFLPLLYNTLQVAPAAAA